MIEGIESELKVGDLIGYKVKTLLSVAGRRKGDGCFREVCQQHEPVGLFLATPRRSHRPTFPTWDGRFLRGGCRLEVPVYEKQAVTLTVNRDRQNEHNPNHGAKTSNRIQPGFHGGFVSFGSLNAVELLG